MTERRKPDVVFEGYEAIIDLNCEPIPLSGSWPEGVRLPVVRRQSKMKQMIRKWTRRLLCCLRGHDWLRVPRTRVDLFGDDDGVKLVLCYRCGNIWNDRDNLQVWNECIHEKGSQANLRIAEIGLDAYRKEREDQGDAIYSKWNK